MKKFNHSTTKNGGSWPKLLVFGQLFCLLLIEPGESLFNCFTPNMFKVGKIGQPGAYGVHSGERTSWYTPQQQHQAYVLSYGQHPMSRLFQPKWRSSLLGPKRWMDWRMNAANMNFYRPGYGYWPQIPQGAPVLPTLAPQHSTTNPSAAGYSEQINSSPYVSSQLLPTAVPAATYGPQALPQLYTTNNYNSNSGDGWTVPYVAPYNRPASLPYSDNYSVVPGSSGAPTKLDYGTKGASGNKQQQQQQQQQQQYSGAGSTKKNVLIANGGYNSMDSHLAGVPYRPREYSSAGFGYSYPEFYSGVVESPAKIAQQLYKNQQRRSMLGVKV